MLAHTITDWFLDESNSSEAVKVEEIWREASAQAMSNSASQTRVDENDLSPCPIDPCLDGWSRDGLQLVVTGTFPDPWSRPKIKKWWASNMCIVG